MRAISRDETEKYRKEVKYGAYDKRTVQIHLEIKSERQLVGSSEALHHHHRDLAYYTDLLPVTIDSVNDDPLCAGSSQNDLVMCSIIGSTVCVVLEDGDVPMKVRTTLISGLRQAVESGEFLNRIPSGDLSLSRY